MRSIRRDQFLIRVSEFWKSLFLLSWVDSRPHMGFIYIIISFFDGLMDGTNANNSCTITVVSLTYPIVVVIVM